MSPAQWVLIAVALLASAFLYWQWRERRRDIIIAQLAQRGGPYHCVEVRARGKPCPAAQALAGRRFLSNAAPQIPLPGCTSQKCRCAYVHFEDRRAGDRRNPFPSSHARELSERSERRRRTDRRRKAGLVTVEAA